MNRLTDRSTIAALCQKYGFSLSKGLGQHFLVNAGICPKICELADIGQHSRVLEIGPGFGTLTQELCERAAQVLALEVDERLFPVLSETLHGYDNLRLVQGDVMQTELAPLLAEHFGQNPAQVCANLPYYITTPIIMRLLESRLNISDITVMVQKEAAVRITAQPGTRGAGAISYAVWYYAQPSLAFTVEPGSFSPPPKVKSAVIKLSLRKTLALSAEPQREKQLFKIIRAAFSQRRKTLPNALAAGLSLSKPVIQSAMGAIDILPTARAETLSLEQYIALQKELMPHI